MVKQFISLIRLLHLILSVSTEFLKSFCSNSFQKTWSFCCLCYWWSTPRIRMLQYGNTIHFRILILVSILCPFFNFDVAIASLLLISGELSPILAPRYSKLLTLSISSPSSLITVSFCICLCPWFWSSWHSDAVLFVRCVLLQTSWDSQALLLTVFF